MSVAFSDGITTTVPQENSEEHYSGISTFCHFVLPLHDIYLITLVTIYFSDNKQQQG